MSNDDACTILRVPAAFRDAPCLQPDWEYPDTVTDTRLTGFSLPWAVRDAIERHRTLGGVLNALPREDPEVVATLYEGFRLRDSERLREPTGRRGLLAERLREMRRPHPYRRNSGRGLTVAEMAERAGVPRTAMAAALEHHGYLEMVGHGGRQRRRLCSAQTIRAGYGHNVDASRSRIGRLEGHGAAAVFPVFYSEYADRILWTLEFDNIREGATKLPTKAERVAWLLDHHGYLPAGYIAEVAGVGIATVKRAKAERPSNPAETTDPLAAYRGPNPPPWSMKAFAAELLREKAEKDPPRRAAA